MSFVIADRVRETTLTTGTGTVTLAGAYTGFQTFSAGIGSGNSTYYAIANVAAGQWEVGIGTYTSGANTLSRTTVLASSNAGSLVNFTNTPNDVFVTQPAERALYVSSGGTGLTSGVAAFTANGVAYASSTTGLATGSALTFDGTNLAIGGSPVSSKGQLQVGTIGYTDTGVLAGFASSVAGYNQIILQNTNSGATASTNFNVSNDQGSATTNYGEFGINSSGFSGSGFSTAGWTYLASASTDLAIGTYGSNAIHFIVNSGTTDAMTILSSGNVGIGTSNPTAALDVVKPSFAGGPLISARFNTSNFRMGFGIGNTNGFPFLGVNVNNASNDNGTFDIAGYASRIRMDNGLTQFQVSSASGSAGGAITWNTQAILDTSGNLGLGVTPSAWSGSYKVNQVLNAGFIGNGNRAYVSANWYDNGTADKYIASDYATRYIQLNGTHRWDNAASGTAGNTITFTQAMTLDASGNLLVGATSASSAAKVFVSSNCNSLNGFNIQDTGTTGGAFAAFYNSANANAGYIAHNGTTTVQYITSSDYRLKENVAPMTGALAKIALLKPCTYTWKDGGAEGQGFIAHELQEIVPDAVYGEKDAVNEDGSIKAQGIDTSFLVATLTAAIQELNAKFEEYKAAHP